MSASTKGPPPDRLRIAVGALLALIAASSLTMLTALHTGPAWVHWIGSLLALATALGVVAIAESTWQRAVYSAEAAGLVRSAEQESRV